MSLRRVIKYVVRNRPEFGLMPGYCILGLRKQNIFQDNYGDPVHTLKTWPEFFYAVRDGIKDFELRKDDRDPPFKAGQLIALAYFDPTDPTADAGGGDK